MAEEGQAKDMPSVMGAVETEVLPDEEMAKKADDSPLVDGAATVEKQDDDAPSPDAPAAEVVDAPEKVQVGGLAKVAVEEMTRGMVYASLAITDDKEGTLKKVRALRGHHF